MSLLYRRLAVVILPAALLAVATLAPAGTAENAGKAIDETAEKTGAVIDSTTETLGEKAEQTGDYLGDAAVTAKIKAAILADPLLKVFQVHVTTTDGVVMLKGEVDSQQSIDRCTEIARSMKGVKSVDTTFLVVKGVS